MIGVGLVGGSIALAAKARGLCRHIVGCARTERTLNLALERRAIDSATHDAREAAAGADLVVLATPIEAVVGIGKHIAPAVDGQALVTDVASVKQAVVSELEPALGERFVGGHPMAGGERLGVDHARADLLQDAAYFITPTAQSDPERVQRLEQFVRGLGARPLFRSPEEHDRLVAAVSHLPHVAAAALVRALSPAAQRPVEELLRCAGAGFRDTTRIAASDPELWVSICLNNREALLAALCAFGEELERFRRALEKADGQALRELFAEAREIRDRVK